MIGAPLSLAQPKQIHEIKDFLLTARRKDARSVKIKKTAGVTKFKVRCANYLYTLCVSDPDKAEKLKQSLPPGTSRSWPHLGAAAPASGSLRSSACSSPRGDSLRRGGRGGAPRWQKRARAVGPMYQTIRAAHGTRLALADASTVRVRDRWPSGVGLTFLPAPLDATPSPPFFVTPPTGLQVQDI